MTAARAATLRRRRRPPTPRSPRPNAVVEGSLFLAVGLVLAAVRTRPRLRLAVLALAGVAAALLVMSLFLPADTVLGGGAFRVSQGEVHRGGVEAVLARPGGTLRMESDAKLQARGDGSDEARGLPRRDRHETTCDEPARG